MMSRWVISKRLIATLAAVGFAAIEIAGLSALTATSASAASSTIVVAQAYDAPPVRRHRTRITVTPYPSYDRLHRDCRAWYEVQHRPSGDVIYPQMNCQWSVR